MGNPAGVDEACESGAGRSSAVDLSAALAGGGVEVELAAEDRRRDGAVADDAYVVGRLVAERAKSAGVERVVFDRAGFRYHGRIKSLAEAAREAGLEF